MDDEKDWGWVQRPNEAATVILKAEEVEIHIDEDYVGEPIEVVEPLKKTENGINNVDDEDEIEMVEVDESEKILVGN